MDYDPRKHREPLLEPDELTAEMRDMHEGFLAFITSDSFSEWLVRTIGGRKLHTRKIVQALIQDEFFVPASAGDTRLPRELYKALSARLNELTREKLLVRARNSVDVVSLKNVPSELDESPRVIDAEDEPDLLPLKLNPLDDRIRAMHMGVRAVQSSTPNK